MGFNGLCWPRFIRSAEHGRMAYFYCLLEYEVSAVALVAVCQNTTLCTHRMIALGVEASEELAGRFS